MYSTHFCGTLLSSDQLLKCFLSAVEKSELHKVQTFLFFSLRQIMIHHPFTISTLLGIKLQAKALCVINHLNANSLFSKEKILISNFSCKEVEWQNAD
jgi:hypothetical protein